MVGEKIGGVNVFGGGLGLYSVQNHVARIVGAVGVSGDTSCADHRIAWRVRNNLHLDNLLVWVVCPGIQTGPTTSSSTSQRNPSGGTGVSAGGFGHPECLNNDTSDLPKVH